MLAKKNSAEKCFASALAVVVLCGGCSPPGPRALLKGQRLVESGRYGEAVEELTVATSLLVTNAHAWNYLGLAYHYSGDLEKGAQAYQQALKLDRDLVEARFNLGCLWLKQSRLDNAKSEFAAFTLRRPDAIEGWLRLGSAQLRSRELGVAEKSFNEALRLNAQNPEALNGLGMIQMQRNRPREAAQFFNTALEQRSNYPPALLNLAIVSHSQLNNRPLALGKYHEYLALPARPPDWEAVNAVANTLEQELSATRRSAASPIVSMPVSNPPPIRAVTNPVVRATLPARPEPTSNIVRTPTAFSPSPTSQVIRPVPETAPRVVQNASTENSPESQSALNSDEPLATEKRPGFFQRINPLNLFRNGTNENARMTSRPPAIASSQIETQKGALTPSSARVDSESNPGASDIARYTYHSWPKPVAGNRLAAEKSFMQGLQQQRGGRLPEAIEAYRRATETDPSYFEAYYNLALAAAMSGDLPQALSAGELALAIRPDSMDARLNFAQALRQANYFFDAANELATVLLKDAKNARAHLALGNLYAQQFHQPAKAREHYLKVLDADPRNPQAGAIRQWLVANPR
jgi:tetratricopeptide (TPR) repeat protein